MGIEQIENALVHYAFNVPDSLGNKYTVQNVRYYLETKFNKNIDVLKVEFNARNVIYNISVENKVYKFGIHV